MMFIDKIPLEILRQIAQQADPQTTRSLADTSKYFRRELENEKVVALINIEVLEMKEDTELCHVLEVLHKLESAPKQFHSLLLLSVGWAISRLSKKTQLHPQDSWLPLAKSQRPSDSQLLWYLIHAAEMTSNITEAPNLAAKNGMNISTIFRDLRIEDTKQRAKLETISIHSCAGTVIEAGGNVKEVSQRYGITTPGSIKTLEMISIINSCAGNAIKAGGDIKEVSQRYGITTPGSIEALETISIISCAGLTIKAGESVRE